MYRVQGGGGGGGGLGTLSMEGSENDTTKAAILFNGNTLKQFSIINAYI